MGALGYVLIAGQLRHDQIADYSLVQRSDARVLVAVGRSVTDSRMQAGALARVVSAIGQRPGTTEVLLIGPTGVVVASKFRAAVGNVDPDPRITQTLRTGRSYSGLDTDPGRRQDYEFLVAVRLPSGRYAFQTSFDHRTLNSSLGHLRRSLGLMWLLSLAIGGVVFYLVGGRALMRSHRIALLRATRDGLTDLPNHRSFQEELSAGIAQAVRYNEPISLLVVDVDDFKLFNDRNGHLLGDELLTRVAAILRDGRPGDRAFRIGADEFALLLAKTDSDGALVRARRLVRRLADLDTPVSVGISSTSRQISDQVLRAQADAARHEAHRHGGGQALCFEQTDQDVALASPEKRSALIQMIDEARVSTFYQPIWDLETATLLGLEALLRPDAALGFDGPAEAFDIAEQTDRVHALDVLAVASALQISPCLPAGVSLFVNLSPQTLDLDADGSDWFATAVEQAQLPPERVVIEVTERFGGRTQAVVATLHRLRATGFKLALDDVGTGNAGLEMLSQVDPDFVKLDRSIVASASTEPTARAVLMAMATYANSTGAYVIAEGIEDLETLEFLKGLGQGAKQTINGGQGYGLGRPSNEIGNHPPDALTGTPRPATA